MPDTSTAKRWLQTGVQFVRTAGTVGGLTMFVGLGVVNMITAPKPNAPAEQLGMSSGPLDDMMQLNRCSFSGFDRSVIPSKAIIRTIDGIPTVVSFDQGWAVFRGEAPGSLVAVCLGPEKAASKFEAR